MLANVTYIDWDTDGEAVDLPERLLITIPEHMEEDIEEIEDYVSDTITEDTGFCHKGFGYSLFSDKTG
jgi:hypothetical protein